jgi:hypothetical protein
VLVLGTDMAVPTGIDHVRAVVLQGSEVMSTRDYELAPQGSVTLPGTFAIVAGNRSPELAIEVTGFGQDSSGTAVARTFAKVATTLPAERVALLRMPVEWLCDGSSLSFGDDQYTTACPAVAGAEEACVAGACVDVGVDETTLADYDPTLVFGGGNGPSDPVARCFDVTGCFVSDHVEHPDADCSLGGLDATTPLNLGLRVAMDEGGICDGASPPRCTVPLDRDDVHGWSVRDDGRIQLPTAACDRVASGRAKLVSSDICEPKTAAYPPCGPWSSVAE